MASGRPCMQKPLPGKTFDTTMQPPSASTLWGGSESGDSAFENARGVDSATCMRVCYAMSGPYSVWGHQVSPSCNAQGHSDPPPPYPGPAVVAVPPHTDSQVCSASHVRANRSSLALRCVEIRRTLLRTMHARATQKKG
eukprot:2986085-Rhodomonas_salina.1